MTKPINTQSQKRFEESLGSLFISNTDTDSAKILFLKSSSDQGVILNGGRNGAKFAPQSLLSHFKKLSLINEMKTLTFKESEVANTQEEENNFKEAQFLEAQRIRQNIDKNKASWVCHLGGGHDHIYPLLKAHSHYSKIIILNIDAHADTRTDEASHSGTPFRQFAQEFKGKLLLYQIGLHPFANSLSTLSPLSQGEMNILWKKDLHNPDKLKKFFGNLQGEVDDSTLVIFSLDADALQASQVPGVSAVNGDGISIAELQEIWRIYRTLNFKHLPVLGIYELNPVYDTLSMLSMRTLSAFLFEIFR